MVILTREQIEERLIALHQVSLELVSDLSIETVLEHIVNLAREQASARYAALGVFDDDGDLERFIQVGMKPEEVDRISHPPVGKGLLGALKKERHTIRIPEISADPRRVGFPKHHPQMQSFLGVPIFLGEYLLGTIYLTDKIGYHEFTEDDERVIETLAAYAAVAISNARLYRDLMERDKALTQRNEDLALLNDVAIAQASSLELDEVLDRTLNRVMAYMGVEAGEIFLMEEGGQELKHALHRGEGAQAFFTRERFVLGDGIVGQVAQTGKPIISSDLGKDVRFLRPAVVQAGFNCLVSIPLAARGNVVGVMNVATKRPREISSREIHLLTAIGSWAGITIENARLHRQARRLAVLEERERIGMDLHDGIVQSIYSVGLTLDYVRMVMDEDPMQAQQKIEQAIEALNSTIGDIRSYISDLRPRQIGSEGLMEGLQHLVNEFKTNAMVDIVLSGPKDGLAGLPGSHATALYHICQEALANVAKHAHARNITVRVWTTGDQVRLEVVDDGQGFLLEKLTATSGHGIPNIHTRARKVGGDVKISSTPGEGTAVLAWVPMHEG